MIDTKIKYWQSKGIEVNDGAEDKEILRLEKHLSFSFPEDFKTFYLSLNGFKEREWTSNMFSLFLPGADTPGYKYFTLSGFLGFIKFHSQHYQRK